MKIKRYQSGGATYTPFVSNFGDTTKTSTTKKDNSLQNSVIGLLKQNGLPNDVDEFLDAASSFLGSSKELGYDDASTDFALSDIVRLQSMSNRVKHNNKLYEEASSQVKKQGAGSEVALTNTGQMYV